MVVVQRSGIRAAAKVRARLGGMLQSKAVFVSVASVVMRIVQESMCAPTEEMQMMVRK